MKVLSYNATVIREEMLGYVDAILERQDQADAVKRMENFHIENVSRKVYRELTEHYKKLDSGHNAKTEKQGKELEMLKRRVEASENEIKRLTLLNNEVNTLRQKQQVAVSLGFLLPGLGTKNGGQQQEPTEPD